MKLNINRNVRFYEAERALLEQRTGEFDVEQLDQRAHEEGGDDRADAGDGGNGAERAAGHQEQHAAADHADHVGGDAAILERSELPLAGQGDP